MADQKHSRAQSSSIPSKSLTDFLTQAKASVKRAVNRAASEARNLKRANKSARRRATASSPNVESSLIEVSSGIRGFGLGGAPRQAPVHRISRIGIADHLIDISFVVGTIYIGNGTLGLGATAYFKDAQGNVWSSPVPVYLHDTNSSPKLVPGYANDVIKHFAGYDIEKLLVEFASKQPSTGLALTLVTAPYRGAGFAPIFGTGTPGPMTVATALSVSGCQRMAGYESRIMDLGPYISNGGGARQNSFLTSSLQAGSATTGVAQTRGAPCGFLVAGAAAADGTLNGYETHDVIVRARLRLRDFVGDSYITNGFGQDEKILRSSQHQTPQTSPVQSGPATAATLMCGLTNITDNSTAVPLLAMATGPLVTNTNVYGQSYPFTVIGTGTNVPGDLVSVKVVPEESKRSGDSVGSIQGPPPMRRSPPDPSTSGLDLESLAKQHGFVLVKKGDVNTPPPIKDDHFDKPTKS